MNKIWIKRGLLILLGLAASVLLIWAFRPQPVAVQVAQVTRGSFQQLIEEDGKTRVRERYVVSAPVAGKLQRIALKAGDEVKPGMPLGVIEPAAPALLDARTERELSARLGAAEASQARADASVARAQASLEKSRADLARSRALASRAFISPAQLEQAELAAQLATRDLEVARHAARAAGFDTAAARAAVLLLHSDGGKAQGRQWMLRAPVAGHVLRVMQENEGVVAIGTPLVEIGAPGDLEVVVDVLTTDAVQIVPGDAVRIQRWGRGEPLQGRVRRVEPSAFTKVSAMGVEEQRVNVIIDLTSPPQLWQALGDGYRVETGIIIFNTPDTLKVPVSALFRKDGQWQVFVISAGRARLRKVEISRQNASEAMVTSGLRRGEQVVVYPGDGLTDNSRVTVR